MAATEYSKRLGSISDEQIQMALDHFGLGQFVRAEAIPFGLFGQNVFVTSSTGEYVLRGSAHYDWQFPKEQFVAKLLHEQTDVPVPWPYLLDPDESIFGWKYGYVLMPRMPGLQLADTQVLKAISPQDRISIAYTLGENLREIQQVQWSFAGQYDLKTGTFVPFKNGIEAWLVDELRQLLQQSLSHNNDAAQSDAVWVDGIIQNAEEALKIPYKPVLVLHDYKQDNLTVSKQGERWKVSGVFDLMEALIGDGELDLVRQLAIYADQNLMWAKAFLDGYQKSTTLRPQAKKRLAFYMLYERMVVWEYFHRPENRSLWWGGTKSIEGWISPYISKLESLL